MKYLPLKLIEFWYFHALSFFLRVWKNSLAFLEEDLAVGLMLKLLFVPLFHDSSIVGKILSFLFRLFRIFIGISAMVSVSLSIFVLAIFWFILPFSAFYLSDTLGITFKIMFFSGLVLFINHIISHPPKKLWQIKSNDEIWYASFVGKDVNPGKLLKSNEVGNFLAFLERKAEDFTDFPNFSANQSLLQKTLELGKKVNAEYLSPRHFFAGFLLSAPNAEQELLKRNLKIDDITYALDFLQRRDRAWRTIFVWDEDFKVRHLKGVNRGWIGIPTPALDAVSEDLTREALKNKFPDFVGRKDKVLQLINILSFEKGRNVCLVGEAGVGKDALVKFLAKQIITGDAPEAIASKRIVELNLTKLLAKAPEESSLAQDLKEIFEESNASGNVVIYVPEIQSFERSYDLMLPYLESSDIQFITATEDSGYIDTIGKNAAFARLFSKVELPPATVSETVEILTNQCIELERSRKVYVSILAIKTAAELAAEYIHDRCLPDSALHILEEAVVLAKNNWVKKADVEEAVGKQAAVPVGEAEEQGKRELLNLENMIHMRLIDQEEAVSDVANALRRSAANLTDKDRPRGSFLFVGPTGVGKTELAKTLSDIYFKSKGQFARFDMSEYQGEDGLERLIGKTGEEGALTKAAELHQYSLILLDEFEKADPKILNLFLAVLEDGRLTSGAGKIVDFTDSIIIATSNAASLTIAENMASGKTLKDIEPKVRDELLQIFKPELLNRFDSVILFKPLSPEDLQKIVRLKLADLQNKLKEQGFLVEFDDSLIVKLSSKGFDPVLGARPLRRLIQDTLEAKLSVMILQNKLPKGEKFYLTEDSLI
ncbi:hypothetical protein A2617_01965 [Candidatus Daviesbacteria bacterium RIFOXYD1_FULL_41_10]|uniref:Sigma-54 factor interaction domain-containing protein n=1 Tax=Candidatus Daviesbacteria bacterium RIFOXYD1_FULL_41_10 TaxID=1797801 RepID=A0A1F5N1A2_9BACT|nr:MAG: hypothetical protein A2617_01965 [Candidatus Daviesbacteria bacterium RIFOXYD1_FULL_41_10]